MQSQNQGSERGALPRHTAGDGGTFNVDLALLAQNANGNNQLSAANGYRSGLNLPAASTFGPGMPDPHVHGLVVTLSTTPQAAPTPNWPVSFSSTPRRRAPDESRCTPIGRSASPASSA